MFLRKTALLLLALLIASPASFSFAAVSGNFSTENTNLIADSTTKPSSGYRHGGKIWSELNLTEDQKARMKTLMESKRQEHKAFREKMNALLTTDQQAKLASLKASPGGGGRGKLLSQLNLTQDQQAQFQALRASQKENRQAFRQQMASILTPEQQAKLKSLRQERKGNCHKKGS